MILTGNPPSPKQTVQQIVPLASAVQGADPLWDEIDVSRVI